MLFRRRIVTGLAPALVLSAFAESARADVSSWVYVGAGAGALRHDRERFTLQAEAGLGTPPASFVFGGLFRAQPYINEGTDLAILARGASGGFVQGNWGVALDAGGYERFWGERSQGGLASLVLGAPWGINLSLSGGLGTNHDRFASLTLGLDFARLTVYRTSGLSWFPNPFATDEHGRGPR